MFELTEVLVPVDFSPASELLVRGAVDLVTGEQPVLILLHVIDPALGQAIEACGFGTADEAVSQLRERANQQLQALADGAATGCQVTPVVSVGSPFYEIVKHAEEFDVDAVVIGKAGHSNPAETLFFGSTAEKVVRACKRPVIVLPLRVPAIDTISDQ